MPKIVELEQHVADLIAAGEVVSRPASVVKELMENSIDAGAGIITVEISNGGMSYIRVTDNGCGIDREYVKTAFLRHATSKLCDAKDLEAIETLGFRGEALAAIAAVSRIELLTRPIDANEGTRLTLEAGEPVDLSSAGCPLGTTIIVRDLFFNTPARQKFMKTDRAEGSAVSSVVLRCALSRPDISFRYIKDGKTEYHTPGDTRLDSCVYSLLGREIEAGFIPVNIEDEAVSVKGFVSKPDAARGNRGYQFFFINGRTIRSLVLQSALEQAYKNSLLSGRFPSCALYITTGAGNVDVNVHPAKTEVRFVSDKQIFDSVYYAAQGALERLGALEQYGAEKVSSGNTRGFDCENSHLPVPSSNRNNFKNLQVDEFKRSYLSTGGKLPPLQNDVPYSAAQAYAEPKPRYEAFDTTAKGGPTAALRTPSHSASSPHTPFSTLNSQLSFRLIGEALGTYIIIERQDSVWFIDKHAAHERIHYNALSSGKHEPMSEALITPIICHVGCSQAALLLENVALLDNLGFQVESFGEDAIAVRSSPADICLDDVESFLTQVCQQLERGGKPSAANLDKIYKSLSCKAAIKAGDKTDVRELETLADRVMSGEISHCPHGRPIAFEISRSALEKSFDRI